MPAPYPKELRQRVIDAYQQGNATQEDVAKRFCVGLPTVVRWVGRFRATNSLDPLPMGGSRHPFIVDEPGLAMLVDVIECVPDITLPELCAIYEEERGVVVSPQTMSDTVRRAGLTKKKRSSVGRRRPARR